MKLYRSELSEHFVDLFIKTVGLDEEELEMVLEHFWREYIPRKFFYLKAGQVCKQLAYINKGSTRNFTVDDRGGEHILFFAFEEWWIGDMESIHTRLPGSISIQAMEDSELLCISNDDMEIMETRLPKLKDWHVAKRQKSHYATLRRLSEVKSLTHEERYLQLLQKHPHIFQRIPLQYIAMYLDIEPPSLSRLRKRLMTK